MGRPLTVALCLDGVDDEALVEAALPWLQTFENVEVWCAFGDDAARELGEVRHRHGRPHPPPPHHHHDDGPDRRQAEAIAERGLAMLAEHGITATVRIPGGRDAGHAIAQACDRDRVLLLSSGHRGGLGPKSIGHVARFVIDHAPGTVIVLKV